MTTKPNNIYILSVDAKDLYEANHLHTPSSTGYVIRDSEGKLRHNRFLNTLDYSLELIKLREVYYNAYRNRHFSFHFDGKEYSQQVINVTFKYSYKRFNQITRFDTKSEQLCKYYIKAGYSFEELTFDDCLAYADGELVCVCISLPVKNPVSEDKLAGVFCYDRESKTYKIVHSRNETLLTTKQLREDLYTNGFYCDGIKYVRFKRSSGSSRIGKCLFINETLYNRMHTWEKCGLTLRPGKPIDLAAWEAYISLTTSSIIDTLELKPENILLIDDYESPFRDTCVAVGLKGKWLDAKPDTVDLKNNIWDGQSLLDVSMFGEKYQNRGMLLLRARFFKSACFNTNIQEFFRDYGITEVSQLNGQTRAQKIEEIKLITTPSSIKFLKFGSLDQWLDNLEPTFGIVKYDKPSHFFDGRMVQCHYQLLNTLHMSYEDTERLLEPSKRYFRLLDTDPAVLRYHVKCACQGLESFDVLNSTNEIMYYFLGVNEKFTETKLYNKWKRELLTAFRNNIKSGHVLIEGTYATLLGNPFEMLLSSVGRFDGTSRLGKGNIYCPMFCDGQELLGSRSPHVAAGNILITKNRYDADIDRYFNLSRYIVCINSIEENILERLSGADMDSDTMLLTSNELLIEKAKEHYNNFLVPTKLVPAQLKKHKYNNESKAELDYVTSNNRIGEIVNLSQELNSMFWDRLNNGASFEDVEDIYCDIAKLDVLSNIEIDRAKRECVVDSSKEMQKIRKKYNTLDDKGKRIKPYFFGFISKRKGYYNDTKNVYKRHETTMDYVQKIVSKWRSRSVDMDALKPLVSIFDLKFCRDAYIQMTKVETLFSNIRHMSGCICSLWLKYRGLNSEEDRQERRSIVEQINEYYTNMIDFVNRTKMTKATIGYILRKLEDDECANIYQDMLRLFFTSGAEHFKRFLIDCEDSVPLLQECGNGEIQLYDYSFKKVTKIRNSIDGY